MPNINLEKINTYNELLGKIAALEEQLLDANALVDAIKDGSIDAFVLSRNGQSDIFALQSIDYTYRILIEKSGEGALSISQDGLILYCNYHFSKLLGVPINKIIGSYFQTYVTSTADFIVLLEQIKREPSRGELQLKTNDKIVPIYISLTNLQPYLPAIGVIVTDQSQSKKHEKEIYKYQNDLEQKIGELNAINRDLEQFVHIISHDIKEPLRKIISYSGRLKKELGKNLDGENIKNLDIIYNATMRLNLLVDDLVQYSSSLKGTASNFEKVDLMKVVTQVLEDLDLLLKENKAQVNYSGLPKIYGSAAQMRQVFSNLVVNAVKYAKKDNIPIIHISSENVPGFYKICVADNGIGIEAQYLQKIFTIFQRLHSQSEYSGTGIGLAICKKIIENHHGRIDVESVLNKESKFFLYLPVS